MREIIVAALVGESSDEELARLRDWRAADPGNEEEYQRLARLWSPTNLPPAIPVDRAAPSASAIVERANQRATSSGSVNRDPGAVGSGPAGRRPLGKDPIVRWNAWKAAVVAASLVLGIGLGSGVSDWMVSTAAGANTLTTGPGQIARTMLDDGTIVQLAPNSRLQFSGRYGLREVALEGRAFFAVHSDSTQPFRVYLPEGEIEVLGTRFDLQGREDEVRVAVVEGTVRMASKGERVTVDANHIARRTARGMEEIEKVEDVYREIEWLGGFLAFQATPIAEVARELEARLGIHVEIADPALLDRTMTGWFADQTPGEMIAGICRAIGARCRVAEDLTVRMELLPEAGP